MVITYTKKQLNDIGEMVILRECLSRIEHENHDSHQAEKSHEPIHNPYIFDLKKELDQLKICTYESEINHEPLAQSVADFFKKAQLNFYAQDAIDPTKVRSLSEVEAELIGQRG